MVLVQDRVADWAYDRLPHLGLVDMRTPHQERDQVSASYNHATYLKPRAKMMQWWADYLDQQLAGNVIHFKVAGGRK